MNLTLKQVPASLHRKLKKRAAQNRRSLNMEALKILEDGFGNEKEPDIRQLIAELREINRRQKGTATDEEIRAAIREGRE
jgi:plasmid stability protein